MGFTAMKGFRVAIFLAAGVAFGPPLAYLIFQATLKAISPAMNLIVPGQGGEIPNYLSALFLLGYLNGIYPALTTAGLLLVFYSKSAVLKLWWVLLTAYLSTCIWYYFDIVINNRFFGVGLAASAAAFVLWVLMKLLLPQKAASP